MKDEKIKKIVRESYAKVAKKGTSCCDSKAVPCCSTSTTEEISKKLGYSKEDINSVPEGANLGLGCGNPVALASLRKGETVLDLGSGAGFDCFLAANNVGENGSVIGVDMTPEMIDKARENARKRKYKNVEFRLGEIENLPAADNTVDIVISNCVVNLALDKKRVFQEAFRVLKPKGRLMVSDIVLSKELPEAIKKNVQAYVQCISGAEIRDRYLQLIEEVGFERVKIIKENYLPVESIVDDPTVQTIVNELKMPAEKITEIAHTVASVTISAFKP